MAKDTFWFQTLMLRNSSSRKSSVSGDNKQAREWCGFGVFGLASVSDLQAGVSSGSCYLSLLLFLFLPQCCVGQCNWGRAQWVCPWLLVDPEMAFIESHLLIQSVVFSSSALSFSFLLLYEETEAPTGYMLLFLLSCPVVSDSLRPHGLQHARPPRPAPSLGVCPSSCSLHQWCHPAISSSDALFSFCPRSFPASGTFPMSCLCTSDDRNTTWVTSNNLAQEQQRYPQ